MDNIFIEPLWRSLEFEAVYLQEIADGFTPRRVDRLLEPGITTLICLCH